MKTLTIAAIFILIPFSGKAQIDTTSDIDVYDKIVGLTQFWSEAKYNFAFFDQTDVEQINSHIL